MDALTGLIFATFLALALAATSLLGRRTAQQRLARLTETQQRGAVAPDQVESLLRRGQGFWERMLAPLARSAPKSGERSIGRIRQRLVEAGFRQSSAMTIYMGSRVALAVILPLAFVAVSPAWDLSAAKFTVLLFGAVALGLVAPSYYLDKVRARRQEQIVLGLPDALDLMMVCVEAGLGINASLARITREFHRSNPVLSTEFELVTHEIRAGKSSVEALRSLGERTGVSEVRALVAMLVQTERFGTNIADTLRVHADGMRAMRMLRAEEQAGKAPLKMLFPTVIIFMATLIVTIGPGLFKLMEFFGDRR